MVHLTFVVVASSILMIQALVDISTFSPESREFIKNVSGVCLSKSGPDEASIESVKRGEFIDEPKIKAYMACLLTESKLVSENGEWNYDLLYKLYPDNIKEAAVEKGKRCDSQAQKDGTKDLVTRIFNYYKCFYKGTPDTFVFV